MPQLEWNEPEINSVEATFSWGNAEVDYAADVYFGEATLGGQGIGRPFTEPSLEQIDLAQEIADRYLQSNNLTTAFTQTAERLNQDFKDVIDFYDWKIDSNNEKRVRKGVPTWSTITDSGALRNSQQLEIEEK